MGIYFSSGYIEIYKMCRTNFTVQRRCFSSVLATDALDELRVIRHQRNFQKFVERDFVQDDPSAVKEHLHCTAILMCF